LFVIADIIATERKWTEIVMEFCFNTVYCTMKTKSREVDAGLGYASICCCIIFFVLG